jgi:hypothetical protein
MLMAFDLGMPRHADVYYCHILVAVPAQAASTITS